MNSNKKALIIFQKNVIPGKVKTRIAVDLGDEKAVEIYRFLINRTHKEVSKLEGVDIFMFFSEKLEIPSWKPKGGILKGCLQNGKDLGEKMESAFEEIFYKGFKQAVIIGTDCPEITTEIIYNAFNKLNSFDVVLGPAKDGGYYLLGMKQIFHELFKNIPWSTSEVLETTIAHAIQEQISYTTLETLSDIDTAQDWENYHL
ncbi:TIGR04282 family arsenosugar biosynthesis glycosyltransferase [Cecembia sp.]|uniref:TIGR04282 family arsenosugar biosynthesis glycosyltransferase n=1 Tax=Cecembia sp. TaxID=1898110 RepID=UPI0025BD78EC|nr:TIGR04282 family arsenosugar biosynthesis glycosyltransferase [Cecembia sp.]